MGEDSSPRREFPVVGGGRSKICNLSAQNDKNWQKKNQKNAKKLSSRNRKIAGETVKQRKNCNEIHKKKRQKCVCPPVVALRFVPPPPLRRFNTHNPALKISVQGENVYPGGKCLSRGEACHGAPACAESAVPMATAQEIWQQISPGVGGKKKSEMSKKKKQQTGDLSSGSSKVLSWPMPSACFEGWSSSNGYNHACYIITSET